MQIIDMITSLYENNFPVRFGVILYSTKFINKIEVSGGELKSSAVEDDSQVKEDISSLVLLHIVFNPLYLARIYFWEQCLVQLFYSYELFFDR